MTRGAPRNGLVREFVPYVYRGTGEDTLTADMDEPVMVTTRRQQRKCPDCGWHPRSLGHKNACGPQSRPWTEARRGAAGTGAGSPPSAEAGSPQAHSDGPAPEDSEGPREVSLNRGP
jgi:hypothetical protein